MLPNIKSQFVHGSNEERNRVRDQLASVTLVVLKIKKSKFLQNYNLSSYLDSVNKEQQLFGFSK
jgi:hypothetical protein